ncbi:hypothetical protein HO173_006202 [Letharia columbiana]|uniref:Uncharacterized protein n=1 Tax=Letharia columbiana TaxID=112416 RepID=A0A8H6L4U1_9LECA|nr:uncharacterized protein HO173_006202 [Letharia columbiana]KAF6235519.1 hypothetical protein HO173_006202 [Letharia columbiana]
MLNMRLCIAKVLSLRMLHERRSTKSNECTNACLSFKTRSRASNRACVNTNTGWVDRRTGESQPAGRDDRKIPAKRNTSPPLDQAQVYLKPILASGY